MTVARAFPYLRYDPDHVPDAGALLAPPYDVVDEDDVARLRSISPWHSIRVESPLDDDTAAAGELFRSWVDECVLEAGEVGIAVIQQRYAGPDGIRRTRLGVACEVKLSEYGDGQVLPHEKTMGGPKRLRLELMQATAANISPVFMVYHDPANSLRDLLASVTDDEPDFTSIDRQGTQTAVWFVTDPAVTDQFEHALANHQLLIADGHHRYESALAYRATAREQQPAVKLVGGSDTAMVPHTDSSGPDGVLAVVANSADEGMCVFPTHRVLEGVDPQLVTDFVLGSGALAADDYPDVESALAALEGLAVPGFVVHHQGGTQLLSVADPADLALAAPGTSDAYRSLDVVALHSLLIDGGATLADHAHGTTYTRSLTDAQHMVAEDERNLAFLMRSVDVAAIHDVARAGEVLPQKSTYFFPKVPTGVVFRPLEPPA